MIPRLGRGIIVSVRSPNNLYHWGSATVDVQIGGSTMGTFGMLFALRQHWRSQSHPVYRAQRRLNPFSLAAKGKVLQKRAAAIISIMFFVFAFFIAIIWCANPSGPTSLAPAMAAIGFILVGSFGLVFLGIFMWPMVASISTSRVIITEREGQTWDILLTTPLGWREIILAKEAAALQGLPPYIFVAMWSLTSAFALLIVTATTSGSSSPSDGLGGLLAAFFLMGVLVIAGFQVYLWAALIGLLASLFTPSRQIAMAIAALASFSVSLFTWVFFALAVRLLIIILSGQFLFSYTLRLGLAGTLVFAIAVLNEILLRRAFRLLIRHLGDGQLPAVTRSM